MLRLDVLPGVFLVFVLLLGYATAAATSAPRPSPTEIFREISPSVVVVHTSKADGKDGLGTGFFISSHLVATNYHVVANHREIRIEFPDTRTSVPADSIVAFDAVQDLALVRVSQATGKPITAVRQDPVEIGEKIFVLANPGGLERSFTDGMVGGHRLLEGRRLIQVSATVAQGSSGGPVVDEEGRLIGVVLASFRSEPHIGFASPASYLMSLLNVAELDTRSAPSAMQADAPRVTVPMTLQQRTASPPWVSRSAALVIGVPRWDSAEVISYVLKAILETRLGISVHLRRGSMDEIFASMAAGDGRFDVFPDLWTPNYDTVLEPYQGARRTISVNTEPYVAIQGLCVPGYVQDQHGVSRIEDLKKPEVVKLFDKDGNGRGEIWIGQDDWQSTNIERVKARDYGYAPHYDLVTGDEGDMVGRLEKAFETKEPVAFYCYGPHAITARYDLAILQEPPRRPGCYNVKRPAEDANWFENSRAFCRGPVPRAYVAYSRSLEARAPEAARLLSNIHFRESMINDWIRQIRFEKRDPRELALSWVVGHPATVTAWMTR